MFLALISFTLKYISKFNGKKKKTKKRLEKTISQYLCSLPLILVFYVYHFNLQIEKFCIKYGV